MKFKAYAAENYLEVQSVFDAPIAVGNNHNTEFIRTFYVINNINISLVGRNTAIKLNVLNKDYKPFPVHLPIDNNVEPIQQPFRRRAVAVEQ